MAQGARRPIMPQGDIETIEIALKQVTEEEK